MDDQWTSRLSEYLDAELNDRERHALETHLASCAECRATLDELRRVVARAQSLTDRGPDADLWPGIAAGIGRAATVVPFWQRMRHTRVSFTLPQAVAAGLLLAVVSAGLVWLARERSRPGPAIGEGAAAVAAPLVPAGFADASYDRAIADFERTLADGREQLDAKTLEAIARSLRTIDRAIAEARKALEADPGNVYLNSHLAATRRRKLELLRQATALAHSES